MTSTVAVPDDLEMHALLFRRGIVQLHDLARDFDQVYGAERGRSILRLDLRDPRERREHAQNGIEVRHRVADQRLVVIASRCPL